jgi:hypothetical protein
LTGSNITGNSSTSHIDWLRARLASCNRTAAATSSTDGRSLQAAVCIVVE